MIPRPVLGAPSTRAQGLCKTVEFAAQDRRVEPLVIPARQQPENAAFECHQASVEGDRLGFHGARFGPQR